MDEFIDGHRAGCEPGSNALCLLGGYCPMRVLICDDHSLFSEGFRYLLEQMEPAAEVTLATHALEAEKLVREREFDLIFLDWNLDRGPTRAAAMVLMREAAADVRIVVLSGETDEAEMSSALELGAAGFIPKAMRSAELTGALASILSGRLFVPDGLRRSAGGAPRRPAGPVDVGEAFPELTVRQADVLKIILRGSSDKVIARELGISPNTVKTHLKTIYAELGVAGRGEAVYIASVRGVRVV
jgi:two-component system nitrate/nitrite response regulator NarL